MRAANDNGLRFLSVCSGIEAASVAFGPLGWQAVAFSEIEKFPSAVLARHYPDVPNLGDFTTIDTSKLGRVDILCGGTPCQSFSVAGLRKGLNDDRGNLTLKFVELAHELATGNGLRNVVWENVVGVLSDKTGAFGCFLAGLVGADSAIEPPARGKWPRHGMVSGPKGRAAWAVKDAQFFGVAQRRRRVLVVADFGNGADPAAVLFEPEGVFRHPPPSRETGKDVAGTAASGAGNGGRDGCLTPWDSQQKRVYDGNADVAPTPSGSDGGGGRHPPALAFAPEIARCDATREGSSQDYETTTMVAVEVAPTVRAGGNQTGGDRPYGMDVDTCDSLAVVAFGWQNSSRQGDSVSSEIVPTLDKSKTPAVSVAFVQNSRDEVRLMGGDGQIVGALAAESGAKQQCYLAQSVAIRGRDGGATAELGGDVATALRASQGGGDKPHVLTSAVRRLTPKECERLQGFPDGYTAIPWRGKPADQCPDGPRYKALGNSWAVPKFVWLGKRLNAILCAAPIAFKEAA